MSALRRYAPLRPSRGTVWPPEVRTAITQRDRTCVGEKLSWPSHAFLGWYRLEVDHVRASGAMGRKSASTEDNGVLLCGPCHRWKTSNGRIARPLLLEYLSRFYPASVA